ncbi:MAG: bacteriohemerythrin [Rhizomicrobium sp.]|nr:bacteriohemerythrin [Rhizomicrobium sp.]
MKRLRGGEDAFGETEAVPTPPVIGEAAADGRHHGVHPSGKALISWRDEFQVGVRSIDDQHQHLVRLVNQIHNALQAECSPQDLEAAFGSLARYTSSHFQHEEDLYKGRHYSGAEDHSREHGDLLHLLGAYQQSMGHNDESRIRSLLPRLHDWLLDHIKGHDMVLGAYLNSIGIS